MSTLKFNRWQNLDGVTHNTVLQVAHKVNGTGLSTTSTSFVDLPDMNLSITPTSSTSKIHVNFEIPVYVARTSSANYAAIRILRDGVEVYSPYHTNVTGNYAYGLSIGAATSVAFYSRLPITFIDSPATTGTVTYRAQVAIYVNSNSGATQVNLGNMTSTITLMELAQ